LIARQESMKKDLKKRQAVQYQQLTKKAKWKR